MMKTNGCATETNNSLLRSFVLQKGRYVDHNILSPNVEYFDSSVSCGFPLKEYKESFFCQREPYSLIFPLYPRD